MKKIPTLFVRDMESKEKLVTPIVTPGLEGMIEGPTLFYRPTAKYDGTAAMWRDGKCFKRYDAKHGKAAPANFEQCQEPDLATGHWPGWVPISPTDPADKWFREAIAAFPNEPNGTYEMCGPKVGGNPQKLVVHTFIPHGEFRVDRQEAFFPTFDGLKRLLAEFPFEGIVWWKVDGNVSGDGTLVEPVCKIKRRDFGYEWPIKG